MVGRIYSNMYKRANRALGSTKRRGPDRDPLLMKKRKP